MLLVPLSLTLLAVSLHPESESRSLVRVEGAKATVALRFQALSLIEVRPELDRSRDGWLDAAELAAGREAIAAYLLGTYRLLALEEGRETALAGELGALVPEDPARLGAFELQTVEATLTFTGARPLGALWIECRLFAETNPWHRDTCLLAWNDEPAVPHLFDGREPRWRFEPADVRGPRLLRATLRIGLDSVRLDPVALAFLLGLLASVRRGRTLVALALALTLAHALGALAAVHGTLRAPPRFVALALALSVAYVGCDNLLRRAPRDPWLEVAAFGLLLGLGSASLLAGPLVGEPLVAVALLGFHIGLLLAGLLVLGSGALLGVVLVRRSRRPPREGPAEGLLPPLLRRALSVLVALVGFALFVERAGWLGRGG